MTLNLGTTTYYTNLGEQFYQRIPPTPVASPTVFAFNEALADELGLGVDAGDRDGIAAVFSGNQAADGAEPVAMAYNGHQFGHFNPDLGDGRAILLGQVKAVSGRQYDIQLKGSGRTRYSRDGDGRSALGPVVREYLLSEAMHRLGIPTTRALAAVTTGEEVLRESIKPGGIITRVSTSFVRVGSFEYLAYRNDVDGIRKLADYCISTNYPGIADSASRYIDLLAAVIERQAKLIASWMHVGFIHGVMNTDNMSIAGETIDYGPCAFMDDYAHARVYSSIDRQGRYAYNQQANIGLWNLTRFAETLLPLFSERQDEAVEIAKQQLERYVAIYQQAWIDGMRSKLGLQQQHEQDRELVEQLFNIMAANEADFTLVFRLLGSLQDTADDADRPFLELFNTTAKISAWLQDWRERCALEGRDAGERRRAMDAVNPLYIPRNHRVEAAIRAAEDEDDFSVFDTLHEVLRQPYTQQPGRDEYARPPRPHEIVQQTFCGT